LNSLKILQTTAFLISSVALIGAVIKVRREGQFPIATLIRNWFWRTPSPAAIVIGIIAGIASVAIVPLTGLLGGRAQIALNGIPSLPWIALAFAGVFVKCAFVLFEELIFRGALISQLRQWTYPLVAAILSAFLFAIAHGRYSFLDAAVLLIDGIGFAVAFLVTDTLWVPVIWHLSKNLSVWLFFGKGTIDLVPGPFIFSFRDGTPEWLSGSVGHAGILDLVVTIIVVGIVGCLLARNQKSHSNGIEEAP
jgi:membrane protease YdiL (CAAX protease family)